VVTWSAVVLGHVKCGQGQKALELFQQMQQEGVQPNSVTFVGALNACASMIALEEGRCVYQRIIEHGWDSDVFVANSLVACMQNVGAWTMLGEYSTRCHLKMWSLGMPYLDDVPCMGMVGKLLNILNRCAKVYSQMISLLFVFCQLVAMQVWWMKARTCMVQ
jgi:pentatricopeptide repeat protein